MRNGAKIRLTSEQRRILREQPEPSAASVKAIPEVLNGKYMGRGAEGIAAALDYMRAKRGRPKKGEVSPSSSVKSVRLTAAEWAALEDIAKSQRITLHALLRRAVRRELVPTRRRKAG
jgi:hypothetical protein